jgi:CCR4-NOT transcription complex subunit 3
MGKIDSVNGKQREKLQDELKKEINKLQRFRKQIKAWQGMAELKVGGYYSTF